MTEEIMDSEWEGGVSTKAVGIGWGKEKDWYKGIMTGSRAVEGKYGMTKVWDTIGIAGKFHKEDSSEEVVVDKNSLYFLWDRQVYSDDLSSLKVGEEFGIMYTGDRISQTTKKTYKVFEVKRFGMNADYVASQIPTVAQEQEYVSPAEKEEFDVMAKEDESTPFN